MSPRHRNNHQPKRIHEILEHRLLLSSDICVALADHTQIVGPLAPVDSATINNHLQQWQSFMNDLDITGAPGISASAIDHLLTNDIEPFLEQIADNIVPICDRLADNRNEQEDLQSQKTSLTWSDPQVRIRLKSNDVFVYWKDMIPGIFHKTKQHKGKTVASFELSEGSGSKSIDLGGGGTRHYNSSFLFNGESLFTSKRFRAFRAVIQTPFDTGYFSLGIGQDREIPADHPDLVRFQNAIDFLATEATSLQMQIDALAGFYEDIDTYAETVETTMLEANRTTIGHPHARINDIYVAQFSTITFSFRTPEDTARFQLVDDTGRVFATVEQTQRGGFRNESITMPIPSGRMGWNHRSEVYLLQMVNESGDVVYAGRFNASGNVLHDQLPIDYVHSGLNLPTSEQIAPRISIVDVQGLNVLVEVDLPTDFVRASIEGGGPLSSVMVNQIGGDQNRTLVPLTFNAANNALNALYSLKLEYLGLELTHAPLYFDGHNLSVVNEQDLWIHQRASQITRDHGISDSNALLEAERIRDADPEVVAFRNQSQLSSSDFFSRNLQTLTGLQMYHASEFFVTHEMVREGFFATYPSFERGSRESQIQLNEFYAAIGGYELRTGEILMESFRAHVNIANNGMDYSEAFDAIRPVLNHPIHTGSDVHIMASVGIHLPTFDQAVKAGQILYHDWWANYLDNQLKDQGRHAWRNARGNEDNAEDQLQANVSYETETSPDNEEPIVDNSGSSPDRPPGEQYVANTTDVSFSTGLVVIHTVEPGDTLSAIADQYRIGAENWELIWEASENADLHARRYGNERLIQPGDQIVIPQTDIANSASSSIELDITLRQAIDETLDSIDTAAENLQADLWRHIKTLSDERDNTESAVLKLSKTLRIQVRLTYVVLLERFQLTMPNSIDEFLLQSRIEVSENTQSSNGEILIELLENMAENGILESVLDTFLSHPNNEHR